MRSRSCGGAKPERRTPDPDAAGRVEPDKAVAARVQVDDADARVERQADGLVDAVVPRVEARQGRVAARDAEPAVGGRPARARGARTRRSASDYRSGTRSSCAPPDVDVLVCRAEGGGQHGGRDGRPGLAKRAAGGARTGRLSRPYSSLKPSTRAVTPSGTLKSSLALRRQSVLLSEGVDRGVSFEGRPRAGARGGAEGDTHSDVASQKWRLTWLSASSDGSGSSGASESSRISSGSVSSGIGFGGAGGTEEVGVGRPERAGPPARPFGSRRRSHGLADDACFPPRLGCLLAAARAQALSDAQT